MNRFGKFKPSEHPWNKAHKHRKDYNRRGVNFGKTGDEFFHISFFSRRALDHFDYSRSCGIAVAAYRFAVCGTSQNNATRFKNFSGLDMYRYTFARKRGRIRHYAFGKHLAIKGHSFADFYDYFSTYFDIFRRNGNNIVTAYHICAVGTNIRKSGNVLFGAVNRKSLKVFTESEKKCNHCSLYIFTYQKSRDNRY